MRWNNLEIRIYLKNKKEPEIYIGDRIDILDFNMNNIEYKQIRCFKKGFSKSQLIEKSIISKIQTITK